MCLSSIGITAVVLPAGKLDVTLLPLCYAANDNTYHLHLLWILLVYDVRLLHVGKWPCCENWVQFGRGPVVDVEATPQSR